MSARAIVSGVLFKAPMSKTSKACKPYVLATIREGSGERTRWWKVFAFSEAPIEELQRLGDGDPIAVAGEIDADVYASEGSDPRVNWRIVADVVLSARKPKAKPGGTKHKPKEADGRDRTGSSWALPSASAGSVPFNDAVPFAPEWR
jgi:single-stranded DNA-binding protein